MRLASYCLSIRLVRCLTVWPARILVRILAHSLARVLARSRHNGPDFPRLALYRSP